MFAFIYNIALEKARKSFSTRIGLVVFLLLTAGFAQAARIATIVSNPSNVTLAAGQSVTTTVTVTRASGGAFSATLSALSLPPGVTASFSPSTLSFTNGGGGSNLTRTSTLTLTASSSSNPGGATASINTAVVGDAADTASGTILINGGVQSQTISMPSIGSKIYGDAPFAVSATSTSGLAVALTVSGPASLSNGTLTLTGAGTVTLTGTQAGNSQYSAATASTTFTVAKAAGSLTFPALTDRTYGDPSFQVSATTTTGGTISYSASGSATINGTTVSVGQPGTASVTASVASTANYEAVSITRSFTVRRAQQTIDFIAIPKLRVGIPTTLVATSSAGLTVRFELVSGNASVTGFTLTTHGRGSIVVRAVQDGNNFYEAAEALQSTTATVQALVAHDDVYVTNVNKQLVVGGLGVTRNDEGRNGSRVVLVSYTSNGTLELEQNGTFTYIPKQDFTGNDSFTYMLVQRGFRSEAVTVTIRVLPTGQRIATSTSGVIY